MGVYQISCPITGYFPEDPRANDFEDPDDRNAFMLDVFSSCDFGDLEDIDLGDEDWQVIGYCRFWVEAGSEAEALEKAEDEFNYRSDNGQFNFGCLENAERTHYQDAIPKIVDFRCRDYYDGELNFSWDEDESCVWCYVGDIQFSEVSEVYSEEEAEEVFVEEVYNEFGIDLDKDEPKESPKKDKNKVKGEER